MTRGHGIVGMDLDMEQSNNDARLQLDQPTNSFVIRVWQEKPGHWRGTVRHVQSEAQRGFEKLEHVFQFVQEQTGMSGSNHKKNIQPNSIKMPTLFEASWFDKPGFKIVLGLAVLIVLIASTALLGGISGSVPLTATATGDGGAFNMLAAFVAGFLLGGLVLGWVFRSSKA